MSEHNAACVAQHLLETCVSHTSTIRVAEHDYGGVSQGVEGYVCWFLG